MRFKVLFIYLFLLVAGCFTWEYIYAQKADKGKKTTQSADAARKASADSAAKARQAAIDARKKEQQRVLDSTKTVRQHSLDSIKTIRKRSSDSLAAIRKYKESRHYKDSVTKSREAKTAALQAKRKAFTDSVTAARKKVTDSAMASRKRITDSTRAIQKHRTDSLATRRKYRESKRYSDSVAVVRKLKLDSVKVVRKRFSDSLTKMRKVKNDSIANARKVRTDSIAAVRKHRTDSISAIRKSRTDSLAKVKERKTNEQKQRAKEKEQKTQLALELKIKKKHQAWSNEKMLKKRWSVPRQVVQNTFTRYNYYFNADKKMDEALLNMQRGRKENFDSLLALYPFDPDRDSSLLASDMDSIIQKASVGIQIHDPRTKWGDDLYLLLGQAYYYKGNYNDASTAFRYILSLRDKNQKKQKKQAAQSAADRKAGKGPSIAEADKKGMLEFLKHRSVHNEALLWLSRTYTESHQEGNAESVIDILETDPNFPEHLKGRLALEKAYIYLSQKDDLAAIQQLTIVAGDNNLPDWVRMRAAYINGQLLEQRAKYADAAKNFQQVVDMSPKIDMDFYARKNLAYNMMLSGSNQDDAVSSLRKILGDGKYAPYYEQVYYVMGRLAANTGKYDDAVNYYKKGIGSAKSTKKQKALSYASLGDVYYATGNYTTAKQAYDSASLLAAAAPNDSVIVNAIRRSAVLVEVTRPLNTIHDNDSLLNLSTLSDRDQRLAARAYIRKLEQAKADSAFRAENAGVNNALQNSNTDMSQNSGGSYTNWYFSNPVLMQQGVNDFKRKWGNRPLADNWRRSAAGGAITNSGNNNNNNAPTDDDGNAVFDENGLPTEESLLAYIPATEEKKDQLQTGTRRAYVDLATAYIKDLEDYPPAIRTLDTLDTRYPDHEHKAEVLYLRYLTALRQNRLPDAQKYSAALLQSYNDTKWADLVRPTESSTPLGDVTVAQFYDEVYDLVMQRQYTTSLQKVKEGQRRFPDPKYAHRFTILEGASLVGAGNFDKADTLLNNFIADNPADTLRRWADALLAYIKTNRPPPAPAVQPQPPKSAADSAAAGIVPGDVPPKPNQPQALPTNAPAPPPPSTASSIPASYTYKPKEEHFAVFAFRTVEARTMGMKAAINDFNTFKFNSQGLVSNLEMLRDQEGMIVTRKFKTAAEARIYLNELRSNGQVFREYKQGEYDLFIISAENYAKLLHDRDMKSYLNFYRSKY